MLIDTHAHLDFTDDVGGWIKRAKENGVGKIICVGTSVDASRKCVEIAEKYSKIAKRHSRARFAREARRESGNPETRFRIKSGMTEKSEMQIYATVGIHPEDGKGDIEKYGSLDACIYELRKIVDSSGKVVGVGECGLNYRLTSDTLQLTTDKEKDFQKNLFIEQIKLAVELNLPLIIHCRNGWHDVFDLLSNVNGQRSTVGGLFHSWTGDWEAAEKALALGFYISFSGIVTFKNAPNVQEVATNMPLEKMLLETDSPFLSPEPLRGKQNEPKNVKIVGKFIADLRHQSFELISDTTSANATKLFGL